MLAGPVAAADRQPLDRVLVEEWPGRDDDEEGEGGAAQANPDGQLDVLQEVPYEECDCLRERERKRKSTRACQP